MFDAAFCRFPRIRYTLDSYLRLRRFALEFSWPFSNEHELVAGQVLSASAAADSASELPQAQKP
jgi:hypothetical protein